MDTTYVKTDATPPKGFRFTGEFRKPELGEWCLYGNKFNARRAFQISGTFNGLRFILEKVKQPRWRGASGEVFFYVTLEGWTQGTTDCRGTFSNAMWDIGNYFQSMEQAVLASERVKAAYLGKEDR